ncbi:MAG: SDR family oxidoreductase [Actinomycetes bacterium]
MSGEQGVAGAVPFGVTGATGHIGAGVANRLAAAGVRQRLVVRDPGRAPTLPGATVAQAQYRDADAMRGALTGVHTLLLVSAAESADRVTEHLTAVEAARRAGVRRVVYTSFLGAGPASTFTLARHHWATEEALRASGMAVTFLRDSMYADFIPFMASGEDRTIRGPAGDGRVAAVARDDICDVAAAVLLADGAHDGRTYDLTGPRAETMQDAADLLTELTGRPVTYVAETLEEAYRSREKYGAPSWEVEGWVTSYAAVAAGELAVVSGDVETISGHPATGLRDLFARHPELYAHLV